MSSPSPSLSISHRDSRRATPSTSKSTTQTTGAGASHYRPIGTTISTSKSIPFAPLTKEEQRQLNLRQNVVGTQPPSRHPAGANPSVTPPSTSPQSTIPSVTRTLTTRIHETGEIRSQERIVETDEAYLSIPTRAQPHQTPIVTSTTATFSIVDTVPIGATLARREMEAKLAAKEAEQAESKVHSLVSLMNTPIASTAAPPPPPTAASTTSPTLGPDHVTPTSNEKVLDTLVLRSSEGIDLLDFEYILQKLLSLVQGQPVHDLFASTLQDFFRRIFHHFVTIDAVRAEKKQSEAEKQLLRDATTEIERELRLMKQKNTQMEVTIATQEGQISRRTTELTAAREKYYANLLLIREIVQQHGIHPDLLVSYMQGDIASADAKQASAEKQRAEMVENYNKIGALMDHRCNVLLNAMKSTIFGLMQQFQKKLDRCNSKIRTIDVYLSKARYKMRKQIHVYELLIKGELTPDKIAEIQSKHAADEELAELEKEARRLQAEQEAKEAAAHANRNGGGDDAHRSRREESNWQELAETHPQGYKMLVTLAARQRAQWERMERQARDGDCELMDDEGMVEHLETVVRDTMPSSSTTNSSPNRSQLNTARSTASSGPNDWVQGIGTKSARDESTNSDSEHSNATTPRTPRAAPSSTTTTATTTMTSTATSSSSKKSKGALVSSSAAGSSSATKPAAVGRRASRFSSTGNLGRKGSVSIGGGSSAVSRRTTSSSNALSPSSSTTSLTSPKSGKKFRPRAESLSVASSHPSVGSSLLPSLQSSARASSASLDLTSSHPSVSSRQSTQGSFDHTRADEDEPSDHDTDGDQLTEPESPVSAHQLDAESGEQSTRRSGRRRKGDSTTTTTPSRNDSTRFGFELGAGAGGGHGSDDSTRHAGTYESGSLLRPHHQSTRSGDTGTPSSGGTGHRDLDRLLYPRGHYSHELTHSSHGPSPRSARSLGGGVGGGSTSRSTRESRRAELAAVQDELLQGTNAYSLLERKNREIIEKIRALDAERKLLNAGPTSSSAGGGGGSASVRSGTSALASLDHTRRNSLTGGEDESHHHATAAADGMQARAPTPNTRRSPSPSPTASPNAISVTVTAHRRHPSSVAEYPTNSDGNGDGQHREDSDDDYSAEVLRAKEERQARIHQSTQLERQKKELEHERKLMAKENQRLLARLKQLEAKKLEVHQAMEQMDRDEPDHLDEPSPPHAHSLAPHPRIRTEVKEHENIFHKVVMRSVGLQVGVPYTYIITPSSHADGRNSRSISPVRRSDVPTSGSNYSIPHAMTMKHMQALGIDSTTAESLMSHQQDSIHSVDGDSSIHSPAFRSYLEGGADPATAMHTTPIGVSGPIYPRESASSRPPSAPSNASGLTGIAQSLTLTPSERDLLFRRELKRRKESEARLSVFARLQARGATSEEATKHLRGILQQERTKEMERVLHDLDLLKSTMPPSSQQYEAHDYRSASPSPSPTRPSSSIGQPPSARGVRPSSASITAMGSPSAQSTRPSTASSHRPPSYPHVVPTAASYQSSHNGMIPSAPSSLASRPSSGQSAPLTNTERRSQLLASLMGDARNNIQQQQGRKGQPYSP